jgi:hypothetical protein
LHFALDVLGRIDAPGAGVLGSLTPHAGEMFLDPPLFLLPATGGAFAFARRPETVGAFAFPAGHRRAIAFAALRRRALSLAALGGRALAFAALAVAGRGTLAISLASLAFAASCGAVFFAPLGGGTFFARLIGRGRRRAERGQQQAAGQRVPPGTGKDAFHRRFSCESGLGTGPGGRNQRDSHQGPRAHETNALETG